MWNASSLSSWRSASQSRRTDPIRISFRLATPYGRFYYNNIQRAMSASAFHYWVLRTDPVTSCEIRPPVPGILKHVRQQTCRGAPWPITCTVDASLSLYCRGSGSLCYLDRVRCGCKCAIWWPARSKPLRRRLTIARLEVPPWRRWGAISSCGILHRQTTPSRALVSLRFCYERLLAVVSCPLVAREERAMRVCHPEYIFKRPMIIMSVFCTVAICSVITIAGFLDDI